MNREQEALDYHSEIRPGKLEVIASKPCSTQRELSLAYTPGVAAPCRRIQENPEDAYKYTSKGNLVAVVSNGTAVLGLGDIGAVAGKPVMEGKGVLFKRFADIDVFDLEIDSHDPDEIIRVVKLLEPTFGGINLEDIKAPECFLYRRDVEEADGNPRLARRSARHRHHLWRCAAQRLGDCRQEDRRGHRCLQWRRRCGRGLRRVLPESRRPA